ncbi:MAG: ketoacyl-ACP synthase III [Bacteroidetes bacterium]|nr:ketoacyl-ACP synthase III [Bacteroidota bacterium]
MQNNIYSVITGSGRHIPDQIVKNTDFLQNEFYNVEGERIPKSNEDIITKFKEITEIEERRYVKDNLVASDIGFFAAERAITNAKIDKETLDYIIVAHNFGDVKSTIYKVDIVPSLAARVKSKLKIENPFCVAYDLPFGCPGWLQGIIQADYFIKSGDAKKILVIGTETLSRISDPHDIDSMIYSDGAGAVILEAKQSETPVGILTHKTRSDTIEHLNLLYMDHTYNKTKDDDRIYIKMNGRKLYNYALTHVPQLVKDTVEKAGIPINKIKKVLIHQANEKMDNAILNRLFKLYNIKIKDVPENIMPMTIAKYGNNSVATVPVLYDMILRGEMENHELKSGDHFVFASVGAGMNVNSVVYKMP